MKIIVTLMLLTAARFCSTEKLCQSYCSHLLCDDEMLYFDGDTFDGFARIRNVFETGIRQTDRSRRLLIDMLEEYSEESNEAIAAFFERAWARFVDTLFWLILCFLHIVTCLVISLLSGLTAISNCIRRRFRRSFNQRPKRDTLKSE